MQQRGATPVGVMTIGKAGTMPSRKAILWTLRGSGHMEQRLWSLAVRGGNRHVGRGRAEDISHHLDSAVGRVIWQGRAEARAQN